LSKGRASLAARAASRLAFQQSRATLPGGSAPISGCEHNRFRQARRYRRNLGLILAQNGEIGIARVLGHFVLGIAVGQPPLGRQVPAPGGLFKCGRRGGLIGSRGFLVNPQEVVHHHAAVEQQRRFERQADVEADEMRIAALRQFRRHRQPTQDRLAGVAMNQNDLVAHGSPPVRSKKLTQVKAPARAAQNTKSPQIPPVGPDRARRRKTATNSAVRAADRHNIGPLLGIALS
jgi:hypothetical protein